MKINLKVPSQLVIVTIFLLGLLNSIYAFEESETKKYKALPDSQTLEMYKHYYKWRGPTIHGSILYDTAVKSGITSTPDETIARIKIYAAAFPGIRLDSVSIRNELIIEKFLSQNLTFSFQPGQCEEFYNEYIKDTPLKSPPSFETLKPLLDYRNFFSLDTVIHLCNSLSEAERKHIDELHKKEMEPWPDREILIDADDNTCIATDPSTGFCIVTIGEFNRYLKARQMERLLNINMARRQALNELLNKKYYAHLSKQLPAADLEEFIHTEEQWIESSILFKRHPDIANLQICDEKLKYVYDKYYDRFFKHRRVKNILLVGSSDSSYIDSLYNSYRKIEIDSAGNRFNRKKAFLNSVSWNVVSSENLPSQIKSEIDTLHIQELKKITTPYGYFICRVQSDRKKGGQKFDQIRDQLLFLHNEEKTRFHGKPDSSTAYDIYNSNKPHYLTPDTLQCQVWLTPCKSASSTKENTTTQQDKSDIIDTATQGSITLNSSVLPPDILDTLLSLEKTAAYSKKIIGPIKNNLGRWFFLVKKKTKGGKQIKFPDIKNEIIASISVNNLPTDSIFDGPAGFDLKESLILSGVYNKKMYTDIKAIPADTVKQLIKNKRVKVAYDNNDTIDNKLILFAKQKILDDQIQNTQSTINDWIKLIEINDQLLTNK